MSAGHDPIQYLTQRNMGRLSTLSQDKQDAVIQHLSEQNVGRGEQRRVYNEAFNHWWEEHLESQRRRQPPNAAIADPNQPPNAFPKPPRHAVGGYVRPHHERQDNSAIVRMAH